MNLFFEILKGTPWWVYALFCYLMVLGLKASKPGIIPFKKLFILPIFFTLWSFYTLITRFQITMLTSIIWSFSILAGYYLGWYVHRSKPIQADKLKRLIAVPGSWAPLLSFLVIFSSKYFFGYTFAIHPEAKSSILYYGPCIALSGIITGFFIGKLLCFFHKFKFSTHTDLSSSKRA